MASRVRKRIQTATSWGGSRHITTGVIKRRLRLLAVILNQVIRVAECQPRDRILKMRTKEKGFKLLVPVFGWFASDVVMIVPEKVCWNEVTRETSASDFLVLLFAPTMRAEIPFHHLRQ